MTDDPKRTEMAMSLGRYDSNYRSLYARAQHLAARIAETDVPGELKAEAELLTFALDAPEVLNPPRGDAA